LSALRTDWRSPEQKARESALARSAQRGDAKAWAELYDQLAPELYRRILMPRLANRAAAEDALSETFRAAIEQIERFEDQGHGLYPWLCRIAHNRAMDMHRARAVTGRKLEELGRVLEAESAPIPGADDLYELRAEAGEVEVRVRAVLGQLNPRYERALVLRYVEERSREECAAALDVKLGTFDVLALRALRAFAKAFGGKEPNDD
jgi:RNA polymerase sigma factor (sigma-70 family)